MRLTKLPLEEKLIGATLLLFGGIIVLLSVVLVLQVRGRLEPSTVSVPATFLQTAAFIMGIMAVGYASLIIVQSLLLKRLVIRPVLELVEASRRIRDGDFACRVEVGSEDEIGELAEAFNRMTDHLGRMIQFNTDVLESLETAVMVVDSDRTIGVFNRAAETLLGTQVGEVLGSSLDDVAFDERFAGPIGEALESGQPLRRRDLTVNTPDRRDVPLGLGVSLLRDTEGKCNGVIAMFTDLTETKRLEREAELNRQMASLGELTAGVVHELRNPLGAISGMAELLARNTSLDESNTQTLNSIVEEIAQLDRTITHFLAFGKPFAVQHEQVALSDIIERALRLAERRIHSKRVTVTVNVNDDVPPLRADSTKLVQAIVNLLVNSVEAVPQEGKIHVDVCDSHPSGEQVSISVSDNGPGVPVEEREKILRPFYSQKESGTGLGVSIVHRIVTAHGGSLEVGDSDMGGARFTLRLPRPDTRE